QTDQPAAPDAEVAAALEFLAPTKLAGDSANGFPASQLEQEHWASYSGTGPRWVAEQIPIDEQEASVSLDQEMQKTHAVFAAALANVDVRAEAGRSLASCEELHNNSMEEWVSPSAETATAAGPISNLLTDAPFYSAPIEEIRESTPLSETAPVTDIKELASPD